MINWAHSSNVFLCSIFFCFCLWCRFHTNNDQLGVISKSIISRRTPHIGKSAEIINRHRKILRPITHSTEWKPFFIRLSDSVKNVSSIQTTAALIVGGGLSLSTRGNSIFVPILIRLFMSSHSFPYSSAQRPATILLMESDISKACWKMFHYWPLSWD